MATNYTVWNGGENPVPGRMVLIECRCEDIWRLMFGNREASPCLSDHLRWSHSDQGGDIVAYKVV